MKQYKYLVLSLLIHALFAAPLFAAGFCILFRAGGGRPFRAYETLISGMTGIIVIPEINCANNTLASAMKHYISTNATLIVSVLCSCFCGCSSTAPIDGGYDIYSGPIWEMPDDDRAQLWQLLQQHSGADLKNLNSKELLRLNMVRDRLCGSERVLRHVFAMTSQRGKDYLVVLEHSKMLISSETTVRLTVLSDGYIVAIEEFYGGSITLHSGIPEFNVNRYHAELGNLLTIESTYLGNRKIQYYAINEVGKDEATVARVSLVRLEESGGKAVLNRYGPNAQTLGPIFIDPKPADCIEVLRTGSEVQILGLLLWLASPHVKPDKHKWDAYEPAIFEIREIVASEDLLEPLMHHDHKWIREAAKLASRKIRKVASSQDAVIESQQESCAHPLGAESTD